MNIHEYHYAWRVFYQYASIDDAVAYTSIHYPIQLGRGKTGFKKHLHRIVPIHLRTITHWPFLGRGTPTQTGYSQILSASADRFPWAFHTASTALIALLGWLEPQTLTRVVGQALAIAQSVQHNLGCPRMCLDTWLSPGRLSESLTVPACHNHFSLHCTKLSCGDWRLWV